MNSDIGWAVGRGKRVSCEIDEARPKSGLDCATHGKFPRPFLISGPASLITPSWNQVVGFPKDWERLRRLAA